MSRKLCIAALALAALTGCTTRQVAMVKPAVETAPALERTATAPAPRPAPQPKALPAKPKALAGQALVERLLPGGLDERAAWALDIHDAMAALRIPVDAENVCAVVAITGQESGFRADPPIPDLGGIAEREIERRRLRASIPRFMVQAALALPSSDGRTYSERLKAASTERQLSDVFEDFTGRVPLAKFLADGNPVRTGGPMQVSVGFAQAHAAAQPYPYGSPRSLREEVFTRRGGIYFGIAHLLHYPAPYDDHLYRFADYNAGRFASRNAAFQKALSQLSGSALELDGDLLRYEQGQPAKRPSRTELAALRIAERLMLAPADIRRDLEQGQSAAFEQSRLYAAVFAEADRAQGARVPRAVLPAIELHTPKTTRKLTSEGFAMRVAERHRACLARR